MDDDSYDSATSKTSFSSQQTEDLVSDSNGNESDAERNSTLRMKNDQTAMENGMNLLIPGLLNNGAMGFNSNNAVTTSVTITGATMSSCSSSTTTTQTASSPIPTPANSGNSETNILMNFIQQQMLDLRLQVRTEVSQVLTENEKQQKQNQEALQQQLEAVQRQVQKVQPSSNDRRVQFGGNIDNVVQAADNLRTTMQSDPKKRSMPENLISMQDIRKTPGLACQVEDRMQSVYANPTLAAAPTVMPPGSMTSMGLPPMAGLLGGSAGVTTPGNSLGQTWVQQQQKELQEYQERWQQQQQQLLNDQLQSYQHSLEVQNREFQEQLKQQLSFSRTSSGRVARAAAEAAAEKQRSDRQSLLQQEEKKTELEVAKLKRSL